MPQRLKDGYGYINEPYNGTIAIQVVIAIADLVMSYIVFGCCVSFEEYFRKFDEVLKPFKRDNLKLKPRKCIMCKTGCIPVFEFKPIWVNHIHR